MSKTGILMADGCEEIEGLTVGDPVEPENATVPVKQKENPVVSEKFGLSK